MDIQGPSLSLEEKELIRHPSVAGVILFSRNYEDWDQLQQLTHAIATVNPKLIMGVDQEGGRVQRFRHAFTSVPPMRDFGHWYTQDPEAAQHSLRFLMCSMAAELRELGITLNFTPVLDIDHGMSAVIGDRSLSHDPDVVTRLGACIIDALQTQGLLVTGKHFPGHGGVALDSHTSLPKDSRPAEVIRQCDLLPFARLARKLDAIMPAHIVYTAYDKQYPAGFSAYWLQEILRRQLAFEGVIISDDLSMVGAAYLGSYPDRAIAALEAGCDLLLVCQNAEAISELLALPLEKYRDPNAKARVDRLIEKLGERRVGAHS